jgi:Arc/MetJ-type ribon-helix-helix transcriptional regulator
MNKTITIRLDDKLVEMFDLVLEGCQETKSQIIRDALRRQLSIRLLAQAREKLVPLARKQGIYTDEDVFELLKRNPKTGKIQCLETPEQED